MRLLVENASQLQLAETYETHAGRLDVPGEGRLFFLAGPLRLFLMTNDPGNAQPPVVGWLEPYEWQKMPLNGDFASE